MFLDLLRARHRVIMEGRPEKSPGEFKDRPNQVGGFIFVAPDDVVGTLVRGFDIYKRLTEPLHRASVHDVSRLRGASLFFKDGNGRVARVMMNAELEATDQMRVLIPIVYRSNIRGFVAARPKRQRLVRADHQDARFRPALRRGNPLARYGTGPRRHGKDECFRASGRGGSTKAYACGYRTHRTSSSINWSSRHVPTL